MRGPAGSMAAQRLNGTAGKDARLRELVADGGTPGRAAGFFLGGFGGEETPPGLAVGQEGSGGAGEGERGALRDPSPRGVGGVREPGVP